MKKDINIIEKIISLVSIIMFFISINCFYFVMKNLEYIPIMILLYFIGILLPLYSKRVPPNIRFKICNYGTKILKIFIITSILTIVNQFLLKYICVLKDWKVFVGSLLLAIILEAVMFWNGIICVYCTSTQLGIRTRSIGIICGMIPIANIIALSKIIKTTTKEVDFEWQKHVVNIERKQDRVCETKYPLLMVHGVFFRDSVKFNYWGRIPKELENNGATIFYGEHQSALSIEDSAKELADRIRTLIKQTGCEKLNIIAHSKGGLDCRYAIYKYGLEPYVASLTTINTPHRGCNFSDYLLDNISEDTKNKVANTYNNTLRKMGDINPNFLAAVNDLTSKHCSVLDEKLSSPKGVYCQSSGSIIEGVIKGDFPLNFSYILVKKYDGYNDGLVGDNSFQFGEKYMLLTTQGMSGISHADVIDLTRKNIPGFDVREWYVGLVADLKKRGY